MFCFGGNENGTGAVTWKENHGGKMVELHRKEVEWIRHRGDLTKVKRWEKSSEKYEKAYTISLEKSEKSKFYGTHGSEMLTLAWL